MDDFPHSAGAAFGKVLPLKLSAERGLDFLSVLFEFAKQFEIHLVTIMAKIDVEFDLRLFLPHAVIQGEPLTPNRTADPIMDTGASISMKVSFCTSEFQKLRP